MNNTSVHNHRNLPYAFSLRVNSGKSANDQAFTHFTLPFGRGELLELPALVAIPEHTPDAHPVPIQTRILAHWQDASIRMLHGIARLPGGTYRIVQSTLTERIRGLVVTQQSDGTIQVANGKSTLFFPPDQLLATADDSLSIALKTTWKNREVGTSTPEGAATIRRRGALHTIIERFVKISHGNQHLRFRLQFEFLDNVPGMAINLMLINDCPNLIFQDIRSIQLILSQPHSTPVIYRPYCGYEYIENGFAEIRGSADIRVDSTRFRPYLYNDEILHDDTDYPHYLRPPANRISSVFYLRGKTHVLQMEMEDFHLLRPKGVLLQSGMATFSLWPHWENTLRLQQGRRRQVRIALHWGMQSLPKTFGETTGNTAAFFDIFRAQLPSQVYANAGFFDQSRILKYQPDRYPRFEGWFKAVSALRTVGSFFDLGDSTDNHYKTNYIPERYTTRASNEACARFYTRSGATGQCLENLDAYDPIWINNEYDIIFCFGTEFLRSENLLLFQQLRWFARHTIEVDFIAYSDLPIHHHGQPAHSVNHTSASAYPSHFWTQGLVQYYFLTGDEDALDVVRALADKTIWYFEHPHLGKTQSDINREMGWAVLTLTSAYEATLDEKYNAYARKLIDIAIRTPLPNDLPILSFGHTSLLLGCRSYLEIHQHSEMTKPVWEWFLQIIDLAIKSSKNPPQTVESLTVKLSYDVELKERGEASRMHPRPQMLSGFAAPDCLAYAYEKTGDTRYLKAGVRALQAFLDSNYGWFTRPFHNPPQEGKGFAMDYRTWAAYLGMLDRANWLKTFDYPEFASLNLPE